MCVTSGLVPNEKARAPLQVNARRHGRVLEKKAARGGACSPARRHGRRNRYSPPPPFAPATRSRGVPELGAHARGANVHRHRLVGVDEALDHYGCGDDHYPSIAMPCAARQRVSA